MVVNVLPAPALPVLPGPNDAAIPPVTGVPSSSDNVNLSTPESGAKEAPVELVEAIKENYQLQTLDMSQPGDRLSASTLPQGQSLNAGSLSEVARGGSSAGIERGPSYGQESVEMPAQVAGAGSGQLVLQKNKPEEAVSQLSQELGRQEVARGASDGQAARSQALEEGLEVKQHTVQDSRTAHQRSLVADAGKLEEGRQQLQGEKAELEQVGAHEQGLAAQLASGQGLSAQLEVSEATENTKVASAAGRAEQLERNLGVEQADLANLRGSQRTSKDALIKRKESTRTSLDKAKADQAQVKGSHQTAGYRKSNTARDVVFLQQSRDQASLRRNRMQQSMAKSQDRLVGDQAAFQDRKLDDGNIKQRQDSMGRRAESARKARFANVANQQAALGNTLYLRQRSDSLARTGHAKQDEFKQRSTVRPTEPGQLPGNQQASRAPQLEDRGEQMVVSLKTLGQGAGGVDTLGGAGVSGAASGGSSTATEGPSVQDVRSGGAETPGRTQLASVTPLVQSEPLAAGNGSGPSAGHGRVSPVVSALPTAMPAFAPAPRMVL